MKTFYEKPRVLKNDDLSEGVYMASGTDNSSDTGSACYTACGTKTQSPQTGRGTYVFQLDGKHNSTTTDSHTNNAQTVTVSFNQKVTYGSSSGTLVSGNGTSKLVISYAYWQNATDNIGLGNLSVESESGLLLTGITISDGH